MQSQPGTRFQAASRDDGLHVGRQIADFLGLALILLALLHLDDAALYVLGQRQPVRRVSWCLVAQVDNEAAGKQARKPSTSQEAIRPDPPDPASRTASQAAFPSSYASANPMPQLNNSYMWESGRGCPMVVRRKAAQ
ncbi:hypothetical protein BJ170DRAFT_678600 [Xylariales sp. AK1849]|nr:hypothetical protein BJ170DRAFT_678600 [Xylariales sp. AK1849]